MVAWLDQDGNWGNSASLNKMAKASVCLDEHGEGKVFIMNSGCGYMFPLPHDKCKHTMDHPNGKITFVCKCYCHTGETDKWAWYTQRKNENNSIPKE